MFGARGSSSAFGAPVNMGLTGVPNTVPMPSGGFNPPSVHNTSLDNVANDTPSTLVFPCNKGQLQQDRLQPGDFVFVLREKVGETFTPPVKFQPAYNRSNGTETALASLPVLNEILRQCAIDAHQNNLSNNHWTGDVCAVAEWATPFGAVLNLARTGTLEGRTGAHGRAFTRDAVNVCVGRRATVKNNFYSSVHGEERGWCSTSMQRVAIQYSVESMRFSDKGDSVSVVMVSMVLVDCPEIDGMCNLPDEYCKIDCCRDKQLCIDARYPEDPKIRETEIYGAAPVQTRALLVPIGRVLHSAPRTPTAHEALSSCIIKNAYDRLGPIEIMLGCP